MTSDRIDSFAGRIFGVFAAALACISCAEVANAQTTLTSVRVASGLSSPLYLTAPPGDLNRVFIVEQGGDIEILTGGAILGSPFLDLTTIISTGSERGLLGLAFDPDYNSNGFFYVNYTNVSGNTVIARYSVLGDPLTSNTADATSAVILKTISQPEPNHNGGCMQFGPDGMLYVGMGDGGGANDQHGAIGNGQNTGTLLGKMLRLDVDNPPTYVPADNPFVGAGNPLDEIWAIGVRNPWRFSFDRLTGDMYIGDVGQGQREEVSFQPAASAGGENYGWRCMEGTRCTSLSGCVCNAPELTLPIHEYTHGGSPFRCSITGGYVYRGTAIPGLQGTYFLADFCSNQIWSLRYDGVSVTDFQERTSELTPDIGAIGSVSSFGEDAAGELYIMDLNGGEVFQIIGDVIDCNNNGVEDAQDISAGTSVDCNANNVPDECDVDFGGSTDCNGNAVPDECDIVAATSADCNVNGTPDECEVDCNLNNTPDDCDISTGFSLDCQTDGVPDECQIAGNDCNTNAVPDECDITGATSTDCNTNAFPDECDPDCDGDGIPDACDSLLTVLDDNFETDMGWTVNSAGGTSGIWERAEPIETSLGADIVQPGEDNPGGVGTFCYVTDGRGGTAGAFDVDGGPTQLTSPLIDMSNGNAVLEYAYWMFSALGTGNDDEMIVEASNDDGANWTLIAMHSISASTWRAHTVLIDAFVAPTDQMRIRFSIEDTNGASFTEALVDDVRVSVPDCPAGNPCSTTDVNCDGTVNALDLAVIQSPLNWAQGAGSAAEPRADVNGDGVVNALDIAVVQSPLEWATSTGPCDCVSP